MSLTTKLFNQIKIDYLVGQDEQNDDVIGNISLVYSNQLNKEPQQNQVSEKLLKPRPSL